MLLAYRAKLHHLPRLGARRAGGPCRVSHVAIIHKLNGLRVPQPLDLTPCSRSQARPTKLEERVRTCLDEAQRAESDNVGSLCESS